ncbi:MAG: ribonuclease P protein component [Actinomycetota bacterium]|nr:ribonuclease P protein component [Actinomycetota bacterium]
MEPAGPRSRALWRVRDGSTFAALRNSRRRGRSGPLWIVWAPAPAGEPPRLAFAIGRRVGGAVTRNRLRRQLRAAFWELTPGPGAYLVSVAPEVVALSFGELKALVWEALHALGPARVSPR